MFNYQDSFFFVVLFKRQLLYFIKALFVCQELFLFFCFASLITSMSFSATAYLDYHIQTALSTTFLFFSNSFDFPNYSDCFNHLKPGFLFHPQLFRLRVSAWYSIVPYFLLFSRLFLSDSVIIPPLFGIVNVFSIIYIIQKIFAIQTILTIIV